MGAVAPGRSWERQISTLPLGLACAAALSGCAKVEAWRNPSLAACEGRLRESLTSPTSYERTSFSTVDAPVSKAVLASAVGGEIGKTAASISIDPAIRGILIDYQAENSFGAKVASKYLCYFSMSSLSKEAFTPSLESQISLSRSRDLLAEAEALNGKSDGKDTMCCLASDFDYAELHAAQDAGVEVQ